MQDSPQTRVTIIPNLLVDNGRIDRSMRDGETVADAMREHGWVPGQTHARVFIDGRLIPSAEWEFIKPARGSSIVIRRVPMGGGGGGGGGKNSGQMIAMIAIMALAIAAPYFAPGLLAAGMGSMGFMTSFAAIGVGTVGGTLLSAGIGIGGMLAMRALIPPPRPNMDALSGANTGSPALSLTGSSNVFQPFAPIPRVYGRMRIYPSLAARTFTEIRGTDQWLRMVFCCGYGPLTITKLQIGETPLNNFVYDKVELRYGRADDAPLTMMPQNVVTNDMWQHIGSNKYASTIDTIIPTSSGTSEVILDFVLPNGLGKVDGKDAYHFAGILNLTITYRETGTFGAWISPIAGAVTASATTTMSGTNNDLVFTAVQTGFAGNNVRIKYLPHTSLEVAAGFNLMQPFIEAVRGGPSPGPDGISTYNFPLIEVSIVSGVTTAAQVKAAIDADPIASSLVTVANAPANDGTGVITLTLSQPVRGASVLVENGIYDLAGGTDAVGAFSVRGRTYAPLRFSYRFPLPSARQWDIKVIKTSNYVTQYNLPDMAEGLKHHRNWIAGDSSVMLAFRWYDDVYWAVLRSVEAGVAVNKPGLALIGLSIKATNQLNGTLDRFNCVVSSELDMWDGVQWKQGYTSNPASVYLNLLQGSSTKTGHDNDRIDWPTIQAFYTHCRSEGFEFNAAIDFKTTVKQIRQDVLSVGRGTFAMKDMKYSLIYEKTQATPVDIITPRTSSNFRWAKRFTALPHAFRVRFNDASDGWQQKERLVYADGYSEDNATIFEDVDAGLGVTSGSQAWKLKRRELAEATLRSHDYTIDMDLEHLTFTRGDRVLLQHDVILAGLVSGRITAMTLDASANVTSITMDTRGTYDGTKFYSLRIRSGQQVINAVPIQQQSGQQATVVPSSNFATAYPAIEDYSGNVKNGAFVGPVVTGENPHMTKISDYSTACLFDGPNGAYATFGTATDFDFTTTSGSFTIEMWVRPDTFAADGGTSTRLIGKSKDASNSWQTGFGGTGRFQIQGEWANVAFSALDSAGNAGTVLIEDQWNYVVATVETGVTVSLYVNNKLCTNGANAAGFTAQTTMILGRQAAGTAVGRFTGAVADIAWYPVVLTPAQIGRRWAASRSRGHNLFTWSEDFSQTGTVGWGKARGSLTVNGSVAPNHTTTMDKYTEDTSTSTHYLYGNNMALAVDQVYTFSIYAKAAERSIIRLQILHAMNQNNGTIRAEFDLSTGVLTNRTSLGSGVLVSSSMTAADNGSYRCSITGVYTTDTSLVAVADVLVVLQNAVNSTGYTGDGVSGAYVWGAQLEAGHTLGEYIPTYGATAQLSGYHETVMRETPDGYWRMGERSLPSVGDVVLVGETGTEGLDCIVTDIQMAEDFRATVMLQDYAPGIITADNPGTPIPAYKSGVTLPGLAATFVATPIIDYVQSDEAVLTPGVDGSLESNIVLTLHFMSGYREVVSKVEVQWKRSQSNSPYSQLYASVSGNGAVVTIPKVQDKRTYDIRIRSVVEESGLFSGWVVMDDYYVIGKSTPPPAPDSADMSKDVLSWTYDNDEDGVPLDHFGFVVKMRPGNEAIWEDALLITRGSTKRMSMVVIPDGTQQTLMVKAIDTAYNESLGMASTVIDPDDFVTENEIAWTHQSATGFPGIKKNCTVISTQLVADDSGGLMWHVPISNIDTSSPRTWLTDAGLYWDGSSKEMQYTFQVVPPAWALYRTSTLRLRMEGSLPGRKIEYLIYGGTKYWVTDATLAWSTDPTVYWGAANLNYYPWVGGLRNPRRETYHIRVTLIGGSVQGSIDVLSAYFDFPDKTRAGFYYLPVGGLRLRSLALTGSGITHFIQINAVSATVKNESDIYPLTRVRVMDRDIQGPLIMGYDNTGALADGWVDVLLVGF